VEVKGDAVTWANIVFLAGRAPDLALGFSTPTAVAFDGTDSLDLGSHRVLYEMLQNAGSWMPEAQMPGHRVGSTGRARGPAVC
jgi:hypothetical protein